MDTKHKELRAAISRMSTREATAWLKEFGLLQEEEQAIYLCDIKKESLTAASFKMHCTRETVSVYRAKGYSHILRDLHGVIPT